MMFVFSATGNSLHVARSLQNTDQERIVNLSDAWRRKEFSYRLGKGEEVGFIFPVIYCGIPTVVADFLRQIALQAEDGAPRAWLLATCGSLSGNANEMAARILSERHIHVQSRHSIVMPDNCTPLFNLPSDEKRERMYRQASQAISIARHRLMAHMTGDFDRRKGPAPRLTTAVVYHKYRHGAPTDKFTAGTTCNGCGQCSRICPAEAISCGQGKPVWTKERCALCLGCLHRCPKNAIQYGRSTARRGQYVHPALRPDDGRMPASHASGTAAGTTN